jgi:anti-sigma regulatory factor (Ser/Thr protein kinase)
MKREKDAMPAQIEFTLTRPEEEYAALLASIEAFGEDQAWPAALRYRLGLVVDELVSNCINHGTPPGQDTIIKVCIKNRDYEVVIEIDDTGPAFDPTSHPISRCSDSGPVHVGGMGLCLVRNLVSSIVYSRLKSSNHIRVAIAKKTQEQECNSAK